MAINFTDNPSNGATQTISGRTYTYNSAKNKWDTTATEVTGPTATVYASIDSLPLSGNITGSQALVTSTNRLYIWNGSGWYNIALVNTNPTISGVNGAYNLASDGTATTITITATDPEGVPITYSIASDTSGNIATVSQGTGSNTNVFTITPTTNTANGGTFSLTFRASDGVNIASAVASFTLQFIITNSNHTTALITSVGANDAVNNSFTDSSGNSHAITSVGGASQGTFSPFRQNGYSWYFDGSATSFSLSAHADFAFGTGDFTVEWWCNLPDQSNTMFIDWRQGGSGSGNLHIGTGGYGGSLAGAVRFTGDGPTIVSTSVVDDNQWHHVAICRANGTTKMYIDGTEEGSASDTTNYARQGLRIGNNSYSSGGNHLHGYMTDVRFVKGTAVYTANFTPPDERLTAITNTSLLLGNLPYLADGSTNNHKLTSNGNPSMEAFTPYDNALQYTAADHDAGISFNGTDAYVRSDTAVDAFTTAGSNWTIEAWVYPRDLGSVNAGADYWVSANRASDGLYVFAMGPKQLAYDNNNESGLTDMKVNQWHHVAAVNSGGYMGLKYFINGYHVNSYNPSGSAPALDVARFTIGAATQGSNGTTANQFNGVVSNVRVSDNNLYTNSDYLPTNPPTQTFTPPTAPFTTNSNTDFLLYGRDGAIIDKSQSVSGVNLNGDVKSSTAESKYLTSSMYFDGTGDYIDLEEDILSVPANTALTLEFWIKMVGGNSSDAIFDWGRHANGDSLSLLSQSNGQFRLYTGAGIFAGYGTLYADLRDGTWRHFALSRTSAGAAYTFIDGTVIETDTGWTAAVASNNQFRISGLAGYSGYEANFYMSDLRITKGLARYTANFTPPTAALQG